MKAAVAAAAAMAVIFVVVVMDVAMAVSVGEAMAMSVMNGVVMRATECGDGAGVSSGGTQSEANERACKKEEWRKSGEK